MHTPDDDPDGPSEDQARILMDVLTQAGVSVPFTGVPAAFRPHGKALPREDTETKVRYNRGKQLKDQQFADRNTARNRTENGYGSSGFAFKKGEK